jgi:thymidylate synthase (FAD)
MINNNHYVTDWQNLNILGDEIGYIKLLSVDGNENTIAEDARTSTGNKQKTEVENQKLVLRLAKDNHTSPLEMASMRFEVKLPIFVARQWMRHRTGHYNEVSGRYKQSECEFYLPGIFYQQHKNNMQCSSNQVIDDNNQAIKIMQEAFNNSKNISAIN